MKRGRASALSILFVVVSLVTAFSEVAGKWVFTTTTCSSGVLFTIARESQESLDGTMNFPGSQMPLYRISEKNNHISFFVDEPQSDKSVVTYYYDADVSGDNLTGTCKKVGGSPEGFSATRRNGTKEK